MATPLENWLILWRQEIYEMSPKPLLLAERKEMLQTNKHKTPNNGGKPQGPQRLNKRVPKVQRWNHLSKKINKIVQDCNTSIKQVSLSLCWYKSIKDWTKNNGRGESTLPCQIPNNVCPCPILQKGYIAPQSLGGGTWWCPSKEEESLDRQKPDEGFLSRWPILTSTVQYVMLTVCSLDATWWGSHSIPRLLPKTHNAGLMRKVQTNSNQGTFGKILTGVLGNYQGRQDQGKSERPSWPRA